MTDKPFDVQQGVSVCLTRKADGIAVVAGARGTANTVHVVLGILRQVVIEYMTHVRYVQATRRHIRRDQHRQYPFRELLQQAQALRLRHIAGQCLGVKPIAA